MTNEERLRAELGRLKEAYCQKYDEIKRLKERVVELEQERRPMSDMVAKKPEQLLDDGEARERLVRDRLLAELGKLDDEYCRLFDRLREIRRETHQLRRELANVWPG